MSLRYRVGSVDASSKTIAWGPTISFNLGVLGASVAIGDDNGSGTGSNLLACFPGHLYDGTLWLSLGTLPTGSTTAQWAYTAQYGHSAQDATPRCTYAYGGSMVEVHDSSVLSEKLWYGFAQ